MGGNAHTPEAGPSNLSTSSTAARNVGAVQGPPQLRDNPDLLTALGFGEDLPDFDFESAFSECACYLVACWALL